MTDPITERVRTAVISELEDLAPARAGRIHENDRIVADLRLTGDDASVFAVLAAKRLGTVVPVHAWDNVLTVADAIDLLRRHVDSPRR